MAACLLFINQMFRYVRAHYIILVKLLLKLHSNFTSRQHEMWFIDVFKNLRKNRILVCIKVFTMNKLLIMSYCGGGGLWMYIFFFWNITVLNTICINFLTFHEIGLCCYIVFWCDTLESLCSSVFKCIRGGLERPVPLAKTSVTTGNWLR